MNNIEKKSLQHISNILQSFNTYPPYSVMIEAMTSAGIDNSIRADIGNKVSDALSEQKKIINDAKSWIDTLISDAK